MSSPPAIAGIEERAADKPLPLRAIRRRRRTQREVPPLRGLLPLLVLLVVWQLVQHGQSAYFPRPSLWWDAIRDQERSGALWPALGATMKSFVWALLLATVVGTALGIAIGLSRFLDRLFGPFLDYCRFMPAAAVVPIAVLFAGYTERMKLIVVVFSALWPILLQVRASLRSQSRLLQDVARSLHLSRARRIWKVLLPSLVPAITLGVRVAAPLVLIIVLLVEIITQVKGLGGLISTAQRSFDAATAYGLLAITGLLGVGINAVVAAAEGWLLRYRPRAG
jgi:ABC-type nitrate/sulfonate/bicarbonate transport system permease component